MRPANVLLEEDTGRALLTDFGLAAVLEGGDNSNPRLTRTGQILGDPGHSSPEQLRGEQVTGQADMFSLGILGYELLTGEGPFEARTSREQIAAHLTGTPRPLSELLPGASADLVDLLLRCLAREPGHRPRADDVVKRLTEGAPAIGSDTVRSPSIVQRRWPQLMGAAVAVAVSVVALASDLVERLGLPDAFFAQVLAFAAWGLVASAVLAWFHGEKGAQKPAPIEIVMLAVVALGWILTTTLLLRR